jgi:nitrous oxide reductase accessory protein NosL
MTRAGLFATAIVGAMGLSLAGCAEQSTDAPPPIHLGDSVCDECNMIISDARWATATIVAGPRGPEARLFDDFNCQVNYETQHADDQIVARWSHAFASGEWLKTEDAHFLMAVGLRTPMGSKTAAFSSLADAEAAAAQTPGEIVPFREAWARLGTPGG